MIEISIPSDSTVVCRPIGDLDLAGSIQLRHVIADLVRPDLNLEIDLRDTGAVEAIGISALIGAMRRVHSLGGTATVAHASPKVQWFIDCLAVDRRATAESGRPPELGSRSPVLDRHWRRGPSRSTSIFGGRHEYR
jgi:anti-anti-sigma regulatory factor